MGGDNWWQLAMLSLAFCIFKCIVFGYICCWTVMHTDTPGVFEKSHIGRSTADTFPTTGTAGHCQNCANKRREGWHSFSLKAVRKPLLWPCADHILWSVTWAGTGKLLNGSYIVVRCILVTLHLNWYIAMVHTAQTWQLLSNSNLFHTATIMKNN